MLEHGGELAAAIARHAHPAAHWIDLSTGINPHAYPVAAPPAAAWQRLPEHDPALAAAAQRYYGSDALIAVAGSQAAIQALPAVIRAERVGIVHPSYAEHAHAWRHRTARALAADAIDAAVDTLDALLLVHPNNPTGARWPTAQLRDWHRRLARRGGTLIVDEAFIDATPEHSLTADAGAPGLIVLRSLGKFFGLAGARVGFVFGDAPLRAALAEQLGPWTVSGPAQHAARQALDDLEWQRKMRTRLITEGAQLGDLLARHGAPAARGTALFRWVPTPDARAWHAHFTAHALLVRAFDTPPALRLGLPPNPSAWQRLDAALAAGRAAGLRLAP